MKLLIISVLFLVLQSCSSGEGKFYQKNKIAKTAPSIINLALLFTEEENYLSFPNWFNDSIISAHGIRKIVRKSYIRMNEIDLESNRKTPFLPREVKCFQFRENGTPVVLTVKNFYDFKEISTSRYVFTGPIDKNGFYRVNRVDNSSIFSAKDEDEFSNEIVKSNYYKIFEKINTTINYNSYQETETGDFLYFVKNKNLWSPLKIDSLIHPNPKDEVVFGTQNNFIKRYKVYNTINENQVRLYVYDIDNTQKIAATIKKDYPFTYKRDFAYNKKGVCNLYIDSVFSDTEFITRTISKISYNSKLEPYKIIHLKENEEGDTLFVSKDTFRYFKVK